MYPNGLSIGMLIMSSCCLCSFFEQGTLLTMLSCINGDLSLAKEANAKPVMSHLSIIWQRPRWVHTIIHEASPLLHAHSSPNQNYTPISSNLHQLRMLMWFTCTPVQLDRHYHENSKQTLMITNVLIFVFGDH